ncbi:MULTISPECIES: TetR/AcrR family transcriptional regulator [Virgibacillus]|uniref:TetR/AcrR family transcriptional regulator n=1 Tax=Virgibacillus halodenitrificans TaxID=1482 RepID=A0ABR7VGZ4_VIRHA|nr:MULTISPECIES: TetR/AcrR family transcriptional regulator [Virgibacillus]AIF44461.1 TetR family transcriptional regulator [Virgibacillus sp. SK37]MBD1221220.1 TetR/AcrR family transcriptional regulator [Virgibacillus halodenitrificans]MCG1027166.1 TetR/AcrR family transcriptional regulator [Virgibacillus halodenitrificans]MEC2159648.1 TetR/AcrR family transcriptional regulator [Virgibacillus halodenitrificans]MYL56506.1 TetR family transcriptional regulator [Virgibacillus halodenitrificans]
MNEKRKEIQKARMWNYFLDATEEIINEKGLQKITIREIADKAGYTSSTVYNYFQDISHLKFFAVMRYTRPYIQELPKYMALGKNTTEQWLYAWECFCKHSFKLPEIYSLLYIDNLGKVPDELVHEYYAAYANELVNLSEEVRSIIVEHNISTRSSLFIKPAIDEGFIHEEDVSYIADTTMLIWTGMITNLLNLRRNYTKKEAAKKTMAYVYQTILNTVPADKQSAINYAYEENREI